MLNFLEAPDTSKPSWWRNYQRNEMLIDLTKTPSHLKENILESFDSQDQVSNKSKVLPYLINKKCKLLVECVEEFI